MADEIDVTALAAEPASTTGDQGGAVNRPIPEVIEAVKFEAAKSALAGTNPRGGPRSAWKSLRAARFIPDNGCR